MFQVLYQGIDGSERKKFKDLGAVARYLRDRDQGVDYRRPGYLQGEYATFTFVGFNWSNLLTGSPYAEDSEYKPELLVVTSKLHWTRKVITSETSPYAEVFTGKADGEVWATIYRDKFVSQAQYRANYGHDGHNDAFQDFATLAEAKAWVERLRTFGERGYYLRRGYFDGLSNCKSNYYPRTKHGGDYCEGFEIGLAVYRRVNGGEFLSPANRLTFKDVPRPEWA